MNLSHFFFQLNLYDENLQSSNRKSKVHDFPLKQKYQKKKKFCSTFVLFFSSLVIRRDREHRFFFFSQSLVCLYFPFSYFNWRFIWFCKIMTSLSPRVSPAFYSALSATPSCASITQSEMSTPVNSALVIKCFAFYSADNHWQSSLAHTHRSARTGTWPIARLGVFGGFFKSQPALEDELLNLNVDGTESDSMSEARHFQ